MNSNQKFEVSIVIPVYNAEPFLRKAVESAESHDVVKEIILVEDKSPDESWKLCLQLAKEYSKVKAFQHPDNENHGCGATRNYGLSLAKCDYITFADADNYLLPNRYEKDKVIFEKHPEADGVYNCMGIHYYSDQSKEIFLNTVNQEVLTFSDVVKPSEVPLVFISEHPRKVEGSWGIDGLTIKKEVFNKSGIFNTALKLQQDVDLFIKMSLTANFFPGELNEATCIRGVHDQQRSTSVQDMDKFRLERWKSVMSWLRKNRDIDKITKDLFEQKYLYFQVLSLKGLKPKMLVLTSIFKYPEGLKKRYGLFDLNFFNAFGRNAITNRLISIKNKILSNS
ncbi:glycosyltransferase family 2 protein [Winogradskyella aurantiaca]|uniref:glycosyltransferase family 2 protein n=1 Tax=Winogradskyella aurantiaca TaxID=2219558 RepID=UPI000E1DF969|nr:glycosyltransferase family A protein [Winogradskyella aurantiaca]